MEKMTVSFVKGKGSIAHNNRKFLTANVRKELTHSNIIFKQESLETAYQKCFGNSLEEYNKKQRQKCRRIPGIKGYMDKIENSKNGKKLFYENVVQVGNMLTAPVGSESASVCIEVLKKYVEEWQERNPNLYIFNCVMHVDEQTPHLHIDYIPVATGYKQGMTVQNGLDKALKNQGIRGGGSQFDNAFMHWRESEIKAIEKIMLDYNLERLPESDIRREHLTVEEYKTQAQVIDMRIEQLPPLKEIEFKKSLFGKKFKLTQENYEKIKQEVKLSKVQKDTYDQVNDALKKQEESVAHRERQAKELLDETIKIYSDAVRTKEHVEKAEKAMKALPKVRAEKNRLENEIKTLEEELNNSEALNRLLEEKLDNAKETIVNHYKSTVEANRHLQEVSTALNQVNKDIERNAAIPLEIKELLQGIGYRTADMLEIKPYSNGCSISSEIRARVPDLSNQAIAESVDISFFNDNTDKQGDIDKQQIDIGFEDFIDKIINSTVKEEPVNHIDYEIDDDDFEL